jgi:HJR/Mrr/RecB family endonuclease
MKTYYLIKNKKGIVGAILLYIFYFVYKPLEAGVILMLIVAALIFLWHSKRRTYKINLSKCSSISAILNNLSPREFELYIAKLFQNEGYKVNVTQATRDGGCDLIMWYGKYNQKYVVEIKRYAPDNVVGRPLLQKIHGVSQAQRAIPVFVSTSSFSKDAIKYAEQNGIVLYDGRRLEKLINK